MNPLFAAATEIQTAMHRAGWRTAVIGGLAVQRWGEPRQTRDVDLTVLAGFGHEALYVDWLFARYARRRDDAREFALERRVVLVQTADGIPIDISLAALPFEERLIARASSFSFEPSVSVVTCSAEDLVVLKAFADRPQDWLDIEGIVVRQGNRLNLELIAAELRPLLDLKEDLGAEQRFQDIVQKHRD